MSELLDRLLHRNEQRISGHDLAALAKVSMKRTKPGTPMREVMNPAQAWAIGVLAPTGTPTPLERHVPMDNPAPTPGTSRRRNPMSLMEKARQESETFHGSPKFVTAVDGEPKVILGQVPELDYDVPAGSQREGKWTHRAGDTLIGGLFRSRRPGPRVELVADAKTGDPELLQHGSHMKFDPRYGLLN